MPAAPMTPSIAATLRLRRDPALRSRAVRGDAQAFALLYERHHQALYRYARSILQHDEDARDALQSAMARAFSALQEEERDFELRPWLFRIVHNEAISLARRRRPTSELEEARTLGRDDLERTVETRERLAHLRHDLRDLPERQRSALVLRELSGLGHDEIASVLETSPRAVKQTIYEARLALAEFAEGRAMECADVQRQLSDGDGRVLRARRVRAHLRSCTGCRRFQAALAQRPGDLGALAPPLPLAAASGILAGLLPGGAGVAGGGAAASAGAAGAGAVGAGGLTLGGLSLGALGGGAKIGLALAVGAGVAGGVAVTAHERPPERPAVRSVPVAPARPPVVATPVVERTAPAGGAAASDSAKPGGDRRRTDERRREGHGKHGHAATAAPSGATAHGGSGANGPGKGHGSSPGRGSGSGGGSPSGRGTTGGGKDAAPGRDRGGPARRTASGPPAHARGPARRADRGGPSRSTPAARRPGPD
ncbi:RNA polymerase sigma factor, partial [Patulibacter defluvii]|uniref:RNA polymerase sigma factor n=1 Tax=Patulibacter defluvii TaxID=3095358 RepID=UPI002A7539D9